MPGSVPGRGDRQKQRMWSLLSQTMLEAALTQGATMRQVFRNGKYRLLWECVAITFTLTDRERGESNRKE